ncbi:MAG: hypothetical protein WC821_00175 [archaeon]
MNKVGRGLLTILFGVLGIIAPIGSIQVLISVGGDSEIASFNSMMILILSVLLLVFLIVDCFTNFNNDNKKLFLVGLFFFLCGLVSFMFNLIIFINM